MQKSLSSGIQARRGTKQCHETQDSVYVFVIVTFADEKLELRGTINVNLRAPKQVKAAYNCKLVAFTGKRPSDELPVLLTDSVSWT